MNVRKNYRYIIQENIQKNKYQKTDGKYISVFSVYVTEHHDSGNL